MDSREVERVLRTMRAELADAERRVEAVRSVISGLETLFPDQSLASSRAAADVDAPATERVTDDYPRGREAVLAVLRDRSGAWFTVQQVADELAARGWHPVSDKPEGAVRATLARIAKQREVEKGRLDGRTVAYRLPADGSQDQPVPDTPDSVPNEDGPARTGPSSVLREKGEPDGDRASDHRGYPPVAAEG